MAAVTPLGTPIELFISYSHRDENLRRVLETHLSLLQRQGISSTWHDRKITAGTEWAGQIDEHLNTARVILLLISPDFMASDYCHDIELTRALERHDANEARVIPVILRPVDWHSARFGGLQALPRDGKPITTWSNRDQAFLDVARGIRATVQALASGLTATSLTVTTPQSCQGRPGPVTPIQQSVATSGHASKSHAAGPTSDRLGCFNKEQLRLSSQSSVGTSFTIEAGKAGREARAQPGAVAKGNSLVVLFQDQESTDTGLTLWVTAENRGPNVMRWFGIRLLAFVNGAYTEIRPDATPEGHSILENLFPGEQVTICYRFSGVKGGKSITCDSWDESLTFLWYMGV